MSPVPVLSDAAEAFVVFAAELNFTRAARHLYITQPALHEKIKKLAGEVGTPLYENRRGTLVLTREGRLLAEFVGDLQRQRDDFAPQLHLERTEPIVVAAGEGAFLYLLGPVLREALKRPGPGLRLTLADAPSSLALVLDGRADIGVGVFAQLPTTLVVGDVAAVRQALACPAGHRLYDRRSVALADLAEESLIVPPVGHAHRDRLESALEAQGIALQAPVQAEGWEMIMQFVAIGAGCAVVHDYVTPRAGVRLVPVRDLPEVQYQAIARQASQEDAEVATLLTAIQRLGQLS